MPNYGGPNGSCRECTRRKVKCDQTYPACRRCIKRNTLCPGVKDKGEQIWRHETSNTIARTRVRRPPGSHVPLELNDEDKTSDHTDKASVDWESRASHNRALSTVQPPANILPDQNDNGESGLQYLSAPLEDILVTFFFDQITCFDVGWYAYLPVLSRNATQQSYLNASIQAASLFVLANQRRDRSSLMAQARFVYGKALTALNAALGNEAERLNDQVLCTVMVFIIIEDIIGNRDSACSAHLSGLQRLLRLRKALGIKNLLGAEVWHALAMKLQLLTLRTGNKATFPGEILLPQMLVTPTLVTYETCVAVRKFYDRVTEILNNKRHFAHEIASLTCLLAEGERLDLALQAWCQDRQGSLLTARWRRYTGPGGLDSNSCSDLEYFCSVQTAEVWNQNRCARIYLHQSLLDLAKHILDQVCPRVSEQRRHDLDAIVARSELVIDDTLIHICGSVPFNLRRIGSTGQACTNQPQRVVGGAGLAWPLEVVLSCSRSSQSHKTLATDALREIGHSIGVKQALVILGE